MSYIIKNPAVFRENAREKIKAILETNHPCGNVQETENASHYALNIERSIYNRTLQEAGEKNITKSWDNAHFVMLYVNRLKNMYFNLTPEIIRQIWERTLPAKKVGFLTHQEYKPEIWDEMIDLKNKRDESKFNPKLESSTNLFTCRCGSKKCTYYEMQIRSADEPATCFITCLECDRKWKK